MENKTASKLAPGTAAERNVRVLRNRAAAARRAANRAEETDAYVALDDVAEAATREYMIANRALVCGQV